jgi:hypothetical protein
MVTSEIDAEKVSVRLDGGERLTFSAEESERVYDELWLLAGRMRGAVTAAAKLKHIVPWEILHGDDSLNAEETHALRTALERLGLSSS